MKTIIISLATFISAFALSQNNDSKIEISKKKYTLENVSISITVNNKEDLEAIDINKLESIFEDLGGNEPVSFELICKDEAINLEEKSDFKIKITGNSNDKRAFIKRLRKIKKIAVNYYNKNN
jgi:hypothetical protein